MSNNIEIDDQDNRKHIIGDEQLFASVGGFILLW